MLARLFTPECWQRSMHYSTAACIYQADSQLETSCTHAGHVTTSRSRKQVRDRLPPPLSLCSRFSSKWIADVYGFELHLIQVSSPFGLRAISQQRFAALSRITGPPRFPFVEWTVGTGHHPSCCAACFREQNCPPCFMEHSSLPWDPFIRLYRWTREKSKASEIQKSCASLSQSFERNNFEIIRNGVSPSRIFRESRMDG